MRNAIDMALFILNKYYPCSKAVPVYVAAILLDPARRKTYMRSVWDGPEMNRAIKEVQAIWEEEYKNLPSSGGSQHQQTMLPAKKKKPDEFSAFDKIRQELTVALDSSVTEDNFLSFIDASPIKLHGIKPIQWWCLNEQRTRYPRLHRMALDILSIPPMSDAPERTFSCARRTVAWSRAKLRPKNIEMVELLSNWVSQDLISYKESMEELLDDFSSTEDSAESSDETTC
jgi:hAT family C-terminal dimerisation region